MQQILISLTDESKQELLLEILTRLEFIEFKIMPNGKIPKGKKSKVNGVKPPIDLLQTVGIEEKTSVSEPEVETTVLPLQRLPLKRGAGKGLIGSVTEAFFEPLDEIFKDYM